MTDRVLVHDGVAGVSVEPVADHQTLPQEHDAAGEDVGAEETQMELDPVLMPQRPVQPNHQHHPKMIAVIFFILTIEL